MSTGTIHEISEAIGALRAESKQNLAMTKLILANQEKFQKRLEKLEHGETRRTAYAAILGMVFGFGGGHFPKL